MKKNDRRTLTAERLGADMEGICHDEGLTVFVPGLLPGETAEVLIVKVEKRYAFGKLLSAPDSPSPDRCVPDCPAYPRCGGCSCRHMTYEASLLWKRQHVIDCFQRIGHLSVEVPPVLGMSTPSAYRNKTALPIGGTADAPVAGFFAPRSHQIIPMESCPNAMSPANTLTQALLHWMRNYHLLPYNEETHTGLIRHLVVRVNRRGQAMAVVVSRTRSLPHEAELIDALRNAGATSVILNENNRRTNVILGSHYRTLYGPDTLEDTLCGLTFQLSAASFFQVNPLQTDVLYQTALEFAQLSAQDTLCDVYCGAGTITLMMAQHCKQAIGIEIVPQAIENAKENAVRNQISNVTFREGAAEAVLPQLIADGLRPDVIVVDPPRKGLEPAVIEAIAAAKPRRLVYISCNVATQARDAALLETRGYHVDRMQPVDLFCWTSGIENVASFSPVAE